jgi:hypothetical protein
MRLSDIQLTENNYFVAMEYYGLILNRTFLVILTESHLIGMVSNGLVNTRIAPDPWTAMLTHGFSVQGNLYNKNTYISEKQLKRLSSIDLLSNDFLKLDRANFRISYADISEVFYDPHKNWWAFCRPCDGKIYLSTADKKREFLILGNQSGLDISRRITQKIG